MRWQPLEYLEWFNQYVATEHAAKSLRRIARRYGLRDLEGDLLSLWWKRVAITMRNKAARGEDGGWFAHEDAARGYAYVALRSCAQALLGGHPGDLPILHPDLLVEVEEPVLRIVVRGVIVGLRRGEIQAPAKRFGCERQRCLATALTVLEVGTGIRTVEVPDSEGGTSEWSRLVRQAMELVWPELRTTGEKSYDERSRKLISRCGQCALGLLQTLLGDEVGDWEDAND